MLLVLHRAAGRIRAVRHTSTRRQVASPAASLGPEHGTTPTLRSRERHRTEEGLLDLNSASLLELKELEGIGDVLAGRIIENRPYLTKIDLVGRRVIPDAAYGRIKHSITAKHAA